MSLGVLSAGVDSLGPEEEEEEVDGTLGGSLEGEDKSSAVFVCVVFRPCRPFVPYNRL